MWFKLVFNGSESVFSDLIVLKLVLFRCVDQNSARVKWKRAIWFIIELFLHLQKVAKKFQFFRFLLTCAQRILVNHLKIKSWFFSEVTYCIAHLPWQGCGSRNFSRTRILYPTIYTVCPASLVQRVYSENWRRLLGHID